MARDENGTTMEETNNFTDSASFNSADRDGLSYNDNWFVVLSCLNFILTLVINPLCLIIIYRAASVQTTAKMFMSSLATSDLGMGTSGFLSLLFVRYTTFLTYHRGVLIALGYLLRLTFIQSFLSLLLLTVDRYISIAWCLQYPRLMTVRRSKIILTCSFLLSLTVAVVHNLGIEVLNTSLILTISIPIGLVSIVIMYLHILVIARRHARRIAQDNQPTDGPILTDGKLS